MAGTVTATGTGTEMNGNARAQKSNCLWPADGGSFESKNKLKYREKGEEGQS